MLCNQCYDYRGIVANGEIVVKNEIDDKQVIDRQRRAQPSRSDLFMIRPIPFPLEVSK